MSEIVLLKIADIDSRGKVIRVEQGKGGKGRYVMLSPQAPEDSTHLLAARSSEAMAVPGRDDERPLVPTSCTRPAVQLARQLA